MNATLLEMVQQLHRNVDNECFLQYWSLQHVYGLYIDCMVDTRMNIKLPRGGNSQK